MSLRIHPLFAAFAVTAACSATRVGPALPSRTLAECPSASIETPEQAAMFSRCSVVVGDLAVRGTSLRDLRVFSGLTRVEGALVIADNPSLETLDGLERLGAVERLEIENNRKLESLSSMKSLAAARELRVVDNQSLRSLSGLERLERLERLEIRENGLYDSKGLEGLGEVGELVVERNRSLISLGGLANVRSAGEVHIHENPRLCGRLGLLPRLERVERELSVTKNWGLTKGEVLTLQARIRHDGPLPASDNEIAFSER